MFQKYALESAPPQLVFFAGPTAQPTQMVLPQQLNQHYIIPPQTYQQQGEAYVGPYDHQVQLQQHQQALAYMSQVTPLPQMLPCPSTQPQQPIQAQLHTTWRPARPTALQLPPQVPKASTGGAFSRLSNFVRVTRLGEGTFGRVYLVRNCVDHKFYALKVLKKSTIVKLRQITHIINERDLLQYVDSPWIIKLHCTFCDVNALYLVTEYVIGGELFNFLRCRVHLPLEMTTFYAAEIVLALEYLHERNIVYRDLKPENILITGKGHIKLCDFGFAKVVPQYTWTLCGTPEYLAPEVLNCEGHNGSADFWSLGILIYEMLFGFPPFNYEQVSQLYDKIRQGKYAFPADVYIDPDAQNLISQLLISNKSLRLGGRTAGISELKAHRFFRNVNWVQMAKQAVPPPWIPQIRHDGDSKWFSDVPEVIGSQPSQLQHTFSGDSPAIEQSLTLERALSELPSMQERMAYETAFRSFG